MSGSDSTSSSSSTSQDTRFAIGDGSLGLGGSGNINTATVNLVDPGAVKAASEMFSRGVDLAAWVTRENSAVSIGAQNVALDSLKNSLAANSKATSDAMAAVRGASADAVMAVRGAEQDALALSSRTNDLLHSTAADSLGLTASVVAAAFENATNIERLSLATVSNVADAYQTARSTEVTAQFQDYRYLMIAGIAVVGLVAVKALK